ncbi:MAG TPA: Xaa-Pro peptidase family protein [Tepidisphaeraceae bacterium]|nr:Xaa-Pro peptidase family protein [Tepidisphaeraceae bacterium]
MLDLNWCRKRQKRLLEPLAGAGLDAAVLGWPKHVYYLSGFAAHWLQQSAIILFADGKTVLVTANEPAKETAADQVISYEAQWNSTQRQEQPILVATAVAEVLRDKHVRRIGTDASLVTSQLGFMSVADPMPIDPSLWQMRRVKDPDELALMEKAIRCTEAMYAQAQQIIEPGITELRVFGELHLAAIEAAGEPLTDLLGNDYKCGPGGGPARNRAIKADEIYVLDLGPCYRGYFADNARSFRVQGQPTDAQHNAWKTILAAHEIVQKMVKPGVQCRDVYQAVDDLYQQSHGQKQTHHLGHGVGLQPHEYPHLNPKWDDVFMEGEVFTAEPGIYGPELNGGIRIENQYLVTKTGVRNLVSYPMELV